MKKLKPKGFTIIELLIASLVFTTLLLLCMDGITRIAKVYVKNASIARTNEFAKSFMEEISQQIKFGSTIFTPVVNGNETRLCLGGNAYSIRLNTKPGGVRKLADPTCTTYSTLDFTSSESVSPNNIRVMDFSVGTSSPYSIKIRVALGEDDLLQDNSGKAPSVTGVTLSEIKCKPGISGSEFCAVIDLTTTVTRRMK